MTFQEAHKRWVQDMIEGMNYYLSIEFLVGGTEYVRDDMWIGRS